MFFITDTSSVKIIWHTAETLEMMLRSCFNDIVLDMQTVSDLLKRHSKNPNNQSIIADMKKLYETLKAPTPNLDAIVPSIRDVLDSAFLSHLGPESTVCYYFGQSTTREWLGAMSEYSRRVVEEVEKLVDELLSSSDDKVPQKDEQAIRSCAAKMKLVMAMGEFPDVDQWTNFPFMSRSVYTHLVKLTEMTSDAINEVRLSKSI